MCICDGKPIRKNQKLLCKLILKNPEVFELLNVSVLPLAAEEDLPSRRKTDSQRVQQILTNRREVPKASEQFNQYYLQFLYFFSSTSLHTNLSSN